MYINCLCQVYRQRKSYIHLEGLCALQHIPYGIMIRTQFIKRLTMMVSRLTNLNLSGYVRKVEVVSHLSRQRALISKSPSSRSCDAGRTGEIHSRAYSAQHISQIGLYDFNCHKEDNHVCNVSYS